MNNDSESNKDLGGFFAVSPKTDCEHVVDLCLSFEHTNIHSPCRDCGDGRENWTCVQCGIVFCSRYVNGHMIKHNQDTGHHLALSFTDLSFWCYRCDSYVVSNELRPTLKFFQDQKFPMLNNSL